MVVQVFSGYGTPEYSLHSTTATMFDSPFEPFVLYAKTTSCILDSPPPWRPPPSPPPLMPPPPAPPPPHPIGRGCFNPTAVRASILNYDQSIIASVPEIAVGSFRLSALYCADHPECMGFTENTTQGAVTYTLHQVMDLSYDEGEMQHTLYLKLDICLASPPPPPTCTDGGVWRMDAPVTLETCDTPTPPETPTTARCACMSGQVYINGVCSGPPQCPVQSPKPPSPFSPPLAPPLPPPSPRQPFLAPPTTLPVCSAAQESNNKAYCYDLSFTSSVCQIDDGVHCPERCGLCRRTFARGPRAVTVSVQMRVAQSIDTFAPMRFRRRVADSLGISENQIETTLSHGSTIVDMSIVTASGSLGAATQLQEAIMNTFTDASVATTLLGVPVTSVAAASLSVAPPAAPPVAPPQPPPPEPPHAPPSLPPPPNLPVSDSTSAVVAVGVVGTAVASAAALLGMGVYRSFSKAGTPLYSKAPADTAVGVVYAEMGFPLGRA